MAPQQRFCPLCDRTFADGEAVLRCDGCGVMHHPACWVKNGGCATATEHKSVPVALAYTNGKPITGQAPHPGEGTRVAGPARPPDAVGVAPGPGGRSRQPVATVRGPEEDEVVIGEDPPPVRVVPGPAPVHTEPRKPPVASRGYKVDRNGKPMPRVYGGHRLLRYWYIPAALLVAGAVALGVIWIAGLFGGDDDPDAAGSGNPDTTSTPAGAESSTPGTTTAEATSSAPPTGGKFQVNDQVAITGVGAGADGEPACLNIRIEPGLDQTIIDCLREGTQLTVLGGPQEAGGLTWWQVQLASGDGWAAEDYLVQR
ncbi:MAG: RING finger protein [Dehalococcoidia bacterium]